MDRSYDKCWTDVKGRIQNGKVVSSDDLADALYHFATGRILEERGVLAIDRAFDAVAFQETLDHLAVLNVIVERLRTATTPQKHGGRLRSWRADWERALRILDLDNAVQWEWARLGWRRGTKSAAVATVATKFCLSEAYVSEVLKREAPAVRRAYPDRSFTRAKITAIRAVVGGRGHLWTAILADRRGQGHLWTMVFIADGWRGGGNTGRLIPR